MGLRFLIPFFYTFHIWILRPTCAPMFLAHITCFLEVRCSWEPSTRYVPAFFPCSAFLCKGFLCKRPLDDRLSYLFFLSKSSNWHFLAWHKPPLSQCCTAWDWNLQEISDLVNRLIVACLKTAAGWLLKHSLHMIAFQLVPYSSFNLIVGTFPATKFFAAGFSMDPCHMACFSKSVPRNFILRLAVLPNCIGVQWVWRMWVRADCSTLLFLRSSCSSWILRLLLLTTSQSGVYL